MKQLIVKGVQCTLDDNEYWEMGNGKVVIANGVLTTLATQFNIPEPEYEVIEHVRDFSTDKFSYIVQATLHMANDKTITEIGEANHLNCLNAIALQYPCISAKTRAGSRVLIRALGLQGQVYSDDEIDTNTLNNKKSA